MVHGERTHDALKKEICRYMKKFKIIETVESRNDNSESVFLGKSLDEFVKAFAESQVYSIDSFLARIGSAILPEEMKYFKPLGKLLISFFIRYYERSNLIGFGKFDWIQYIINSFLKDPLTLTLFLDNAPKIFTFNYDTFFERSLIAHFVRYHGADRRLAVQKVRDLNITHIYGSIQSIEPMDESEILKASMNDIKVIGEERSLDDLSKRIGEQLGDCKNIYFLGFGFDRDNCDLLFKYYDFAKGMELGTKFYATSVGLTNHDLSQIGIFLEDNYGFKIDFNTHYHKNVDCMDLIRVLNPIFVGEAVYEDL
jgi:hypothetical protein